MKATVQVALVQMNPARLEPETNVARMIAFVEEAASQGAELILFPELATVGYIQERNKEYGRQLVEKSEKVPGPTTDIIGEAAKKAGVYVLFGMSQVHPTVPATLYNSAVLVGPQGTVVGIQHKVHIPGEEKHYFYGGNSIEVWQTDLGGISCAICTDLSFPEMTRIAALKGAEIQTSIINGQTHKHKGRTYLAERFKMWAHTRSCENGNFVLACNRVGVEGKNTFCGNSGVTNPSGVTIAESTSTEEEEVIMATLHADELVEERIYKPRFIDRRPDLYGLLTERW